MGGGSTVYCLLDGACDYRHVLRCLSRSVLFLERAPRAKLCLLPLILMTLLLLLVVTKITMLLQQLLLLLLLVVDITITTHCRIPLFLCKFGFCNRFWMRCLTFFWTRLELSTYIEKRSIFCLETTIIR